MKHCRQNGFSLIELLIVMAIIGVLSSLAVPNFLRARQNAYEVSAVGFLHTLQTAQIAYRTSNGVYAKDFSQLPEVWLNTAPPTGPHGQGKGNPGRGRGQGQGQGQGRGQGQGQAPGQEQGRAQGRGQGHDQGQGQGQEQGQWQAQDHEQERTQAQWQGRGRGQGQGQPGSGGSPSTPSINVSSYYIYALNVVNDEQWECTAAPTFDRDAGRYFYTNETGAIRFRVGATASATSPVVQ